MNVKNSECAFVTLVIQHAKRIRLVVCALAVCTIFFHIISQTARFTIKVIEHKMCVLIFHTALLEKFLILRRTERDMTKNVCWSSCKIPVILVRFS
jgi:hypothetical protein